MTDLKDLINHRVEALRPKLQDTSRRNPLINNVLTARSASFIRIVDEKPQSIFDYLFGPNPRSMMLVPLPPTDIDPPDENTHEFRNAFQNAQGTDEAYNKIINEIDYELDEYAIDKEEKADRALKDRVRAMLEMPPRPESDQLSDLINHAKSHGIDPSSSLPLQNVQADDNRYEDDELQTLLLPKTFKSRMGRILSKAKMYEEERGLEVVYLVLGYLRWTLPNADKNDFFKSPIILLPIRLVKAKSPEGEIFNISKNGDPIFNPSLAHKLSVEAGIDIQDIIDETSNEELDVEKLFAEVQDVSPKNMQWKVMREATFGIYPFQGIELYYDLDTDGIDFSEFSIVSELMLGKESHSSTNSSFSEVDVESDIGKKLVPHIVLDADSSQFIALLKIANNENVALEGPPGSGKSQTIVNAIANALQNGKKVLFVAQKVTALEVVYSRLQSLGLEHFVLPLMGGYGSTDEFYSAVDSRLKLTPHQRESDLQNKQVKLEQQREKLSEYIKIITQHVAGTTLTVHQVLGLSVSQHEAITKLERNFRSISINFLKYSQSFNSKDVGKAAETISAWCEHLASSELEPESVWVDADPIKMDTSVINNALVLGRDSITNLETALQEIGELRSNKLETLFTSPMNAIEDALNFISAGKRSAELDAIQKKLGQENVRSALTALSESYQLFEDSAFQLGVNPEQLKLLIASAKNNHLFDDFLELFALDRFDATTINAIKTELNQEREKKALMIDFQKELESIGIVIGPNKVAMLGDIENHKDALNNVSQQLKILGINGTINEVQKARKLLRSLNELIGESNLPIPNEVKSVRNIIQQAGMFSFLSKEVKKSKLTALNWLEGYSTSDNKNRIIEGLDQLLELSLSWHNLELSEHIERPSNSDTKVFAEVLIALDELRTTSEQLNITSNLTTKLLAYEGLSEKAKLFDDLEPGETWASLQEDLSTNYERLEFIESNKIELAEAQNKLIKFDILQTGRIRTLINNSEEIEELLKNIESSKEKLGSGFESHETVKEFLSAASEYEDLAEPVREILIDSEDSYITDLIKDILPNLRIISECAENLIKAKHGDFFEHSDYLSISNCKDIINQHQFDRSGLDALMTQRSIFKDAENQGLAELLTKLVTQKHNESNKNIATAAIVYQLQKLVDASFGGVLMEFTGTNLTTARKLLQELDRSLIKAAPSEVEYAALTKSDPPTGISFGRKSEYTDLALLKHELQKKRKTPPRKILKRANGALLELFPCWMMVPSAVAQHLPRKEEFDLVIIDEASQMTPENSISALMRAKNALIAGDTNQLPPTNFFKGLSSDEGEDEDITTTEESILEMANIQFHPKHRLLWHYRSRHEDLIAFSNHYVYDSELVIFPSPGSAKDELGISLVQVNGIFQRGINPAEAQVMHEAIIQFMTNSPHRSLGIAVMNQSQMEHIESLVLREAETNKAVSNYIDKWVNDKEGLEKFFVKNLENVQGDERDVIFVGTVYGRDAEGKFYQRFGPINGPSGKRRLNVLFSRAKEQVVTFSSIPLSDFNPSPTNEGATLLRRWLEFSATKRLGEKPQNHERAGYPDSPFEEHVIEAIKSLGYEAVPQVGVSSYFIDIGVKHHSYPFGYICGIECDGATYHSSKSARVRDRLREDVLIRLGWNLYRIWSTDWFRDPLGYRNILNEYLSKQLSTMLESMPEIDSTSSEAVDGEINNKDNSPLTILDDISQDVSLCEVEIGSKITVRYLDGARAGVVTKFWVQHETNDPVYKLEGYRTLGIDSPLGEAVIGAGVGDIVHFNIQHEKIPVEVTEIEQ